MLSACRTYPKELIAAIGLAWNQFWFTSRRSAHLILLQHIVGIFAFVWLASYSSELVSMFGQHGWVSRQAVAQMMTDGNSSQFVPGFSHLFLIESAPLLWTSHAIALAVVGLFAIGVASRVTAPLTLLVVLSYVHRAPMMTTPFETILCALLLYLSICPRGSWFSLRQGSDESSWMANVVTRLIQIHLCEFYVLIAASKLSTPAWWTGDAVQHLMTDSQHCLADFSSLTSNMYLMNAMTHAWLVFELLFPVLIWIRQLRPLMILLSSLIWLFAAVVSGQVGFCLLMLAANVVFISPDRLSGLAKKS